MHGGFKKTAQFRTTCATRARVSPGRGTATYATFTARGARSESGIVSSEGMARDSREFKRLDWENEQLETLGVPRTGRR